MEIVTVTQGIFLSQRRKEYHKNLKKKRYKYNNPGIKKAPWIDLCLEIKDPFMISSNLIESDKIQD